LFGGFLLGGFNCLQNVNILEYAENNYAPVFEEIKKGVVSSKCGNTVLFNPFCLSTN
jgi:hypothetical protein